MAAIDPPYCRLTALTLNPALPDPGQHGSGPSRGAHHQHERR